MAQDKQLAGKRMATGKPSPEREPNFFQVTAQGDESPIDSVARVAADPVIRGASTARKFVAQTFGETDLTSYVDQLAVQAQAVNGGDLSALEAMLTTQATTLDAMFNHMAIRAAHASHVPTREVFMRTALKAQAQCANTVKILGELKNPRSVAFIRQQNNANGHQQVNNNAPANGLSGAVRAGGHAENIDQSNELLEHANGEWLDTGAAGEAGRGYQTLEAVGAVNRTED